ncbi:flagellar basal-body rod protein FlgB [Paraburkholderia sp. Clong3]|uniref:flagellar basal body rod protein FlgB n=1 Tax=Paraburkholderia sp. Clong3 TaxID=2991061 RepID=UPI003D22ABC5
MTLNLVAAIAGKALDGLFARQTATAQNVANAGSANFTPLRVSFEDALRDAAALHPGDTPASVLARVAGVAPRIDAPLPLASNTVRIDDEIATASETSARYAMLAGMLDRTMQIEKLAIGGG